jgi:hypothetical protein
MARKDRIPEVYYYEWRAATWFGSKTRLQLDSSGRGIYRELLDLCYAQGNCPRDPDLQATFCGCTRDEIERVWPLIKRHFFVSKHDPEMLENKVANVFRRSFFKFHARQKQNGKNGGRPKANPLKEIQTTGLENEKPKRTDTKRTDTKRTETTTPSQSQPAITQTEWPLATEAVCSEFVTTDSAMMLSIVHTAAQAAAAESLVLTDEMLAEALRDARRANPKQWSAALYLSTVPNILRNWAAEARAKRRAHA